MNLSLLTGYFRFGFGFGFGSRQQTGEGPDLDVEVEIVWAHGGCTARTAGTAVVWEDIGLSVTVTVSAEC